MNKGPLDTTQLAVHPPRRVEKPWGYELVYAHTARYVGKILHVDAGELLSRQYHEVKDESLYVLSGRLRVEIGPPGKAEPYEVGPGEAFRIPPRTVHRFVALEDTDLLEVSTPELDDVVRLEDRYGRA